MLDQSLGGTDDTTLAAVCKSEGRILITLDIGFADIRTYPPSEYPGIIVLRLRYQDTAHVVTVTTRLIHHLKVEHPAGHLWVVEDSLIRIR